MKKLSLLIFSLLTEASFANSKEAYYEYCAGTQLHYQNGAKGGPGGHAVSYIEGLCKDYSKEFPQVIPCSETNDIDGLKHTGVGISLDLEYKNVMWVAVPGRNLFLFGNKSKNNLPLLHKHLRTLVKESLRRKIFEGVKLYDEKSSMPRKAFEEVFKSFGINPGGTTEKITNKFLTYTSQEYETFTTLLSLGTDIGVNLARDMACIKVPIQNDRLKDVANYLNKINQQFYYSEDQSYHWSMLLNNCTHLSSNIGHFSGAIKNYYDVDNTITPGVTGYIDALSDSPTRMIRNIAAPFDVIGVIQDSKIPQKKIEILFSKDYSKTNSFFNNNDLTGLSVTKLKKISVQDIKKD